MSLRERIRRLRGRHGAQRDAVPVNFRTVEITDSRFPPHVTHEVAWDSSTGRLRDLRDVQTREVVRWDAPDADTRQWLGEGYENAGRHDGLGTANGQNGRNEDTHHISAGFKGTLFNHPPPADRTRYTYTLHQRYQYRKGDGPWQDFAGSQFTITRTAEWRQPAWGITLSKTGPGVNFSTRPYDLSPLP